MSFIFDAHPLVLQYLVPSLLKLYVDIEFTGRDNVFHEKFQMRSVIGDILAYLWGRRAHRETWIETAAKVKGTGDRDSRVSVLLRSFRAYFFPFCWDAGVGGGTATGFLCLVNPIQHSVAVKFYPIDAQHFLCTCLASNLV